MNTTTEKTSMLGLNLDHFQKSLLTTHTSLTLNLKVTLVGMKTYMIKTNWSTKELTKNLMIKFRMMT